MKKTPLFWCVVLLHAGDRREISLPLFTDTRLLMSFKKEESLLILRSNLRGMGFLCYTVLSKGKENGFVVSGRCINFETDNHLSCVSRCDKVCATCPASHQQSVDSQTAILKFSFHDRHADHKAVIFSTQGHFSSTTGST